MKQTDKHYNIVSEFAKLFPSEDDFVILKETKNGTRYIEYAFKEGRPHDFTCLSWYLKPHPKYLEEHPDWGTPPYHKIGEIFHLCEFTCGLQNKRLLKERCNVGSPKRDCGYIQHKKWKYNEPIKCACWTINPISQKEISRYYRMVHYAEREQFLMYFANYYKENILPTLLKECEDIDFWEKRPVIKLINVAKGVEVSIKESGMDTTIDYDSKPVKQ